MKVNEIIDAFELAKANLEPHGKGKYFRDGRHCAIGWLAAQAGVERDTLKLATGGENDLITDQCTEVLIYAVQDKFDLDSTEIGEIILENDAHWDSWDDAIQWIKDQTSSGEEHEN